MTIEPTTRCPEIGPGSKTFFRTKIINNKKVQTAKQSSEITVKGVFEKTFIHEKMINNTGIKEI
jgi:hypothetical protein